MTHWRWQILVMLMFAFMISSKKAYLEILGEIWKLILNGIWISRQLCQISGQISKMLYIFIYLFTNRVCIEKIIITKKLLKIIKKIILMSKNALKANRTSLFYICCQNFCYMWWFFKAPWRVRSTLKNHQIWQKWRKTMFHLPSTHFSTVLRVSVTCYAIFFQYRN